MFTQEIKFLRPVMPTVHTCHQPLPCGYGLQHIIFCWFKFKASFPNTL